MNVLYICSTIHEVSKNMYTSIILLCFLAKFDKSEPDIMLNHTSLILQSHITDSVSESNLNQTLISLRTSSIFSSTVTFKTSPIPQITSEIHVSECKIVQSGTNDMGRINYTKDNYMCNITNSTEIYPQCRSNMFGTDYKGKKNHTIHNHACLYWIDFVQSGYTSSNFPDNSIGEALNFCRNLYSWTLLLVSQCQWESENRLL